MEALQQEIVSIENSINHGNGNQPLNHEQENEPLRYEFITSKHLGKQYLHLVDKGQIYLKKDSYKGSTFYACTYKGCKHRVVIRTDDECKNTKTTVRHTHPARWDEIATLRVVNNIKNDMKVPFSFSAKPRAIFNKHVVQ